MHGERYMQGLNRSAMSFVFYGCTGGPRGPSRLEAFTEVHLKKSKKQRVIVFWVNYEVYLYIINKFYNE